MQLDYTQPMTDVFCRVMESLAFYFVDPVEAHQVNMDLDLQSPYLHASMRFEGPHVGQINMYLPQSMMTTIWANMLGCDEEDEHSASQQKDAVCELLNVICGQVLTEIWGTGPIFDLRLPNITSIERDQVASIALQNESHCFIGDNGLVLLSIQVDPST